MGFSLAQLSLSFVIPRHPADVYASPIVLISFLLTFLIVASTWYSHHWLFDHLFVPNAATIVVNFATLASIVWLVYQLQLYIHFLPTPDRAYATVSYLATYAFAWLMLALLYGMCLRLQWRAISEKERRSALYKTGRLGTIGLATAVSTVAMAAFHQPIETTFWVIFVAALIWRIASRKWLGNASAA